MADVEKVKNSLRHCIPYKCDGCDYHGIFVGCAVQLRIDALSVIEELQAEIERLKAEAEKAFISGQNNILEAQAGFLSSIRKDGEAD